MDARQSFLSGGDEPLAVVFNHRFFRPATQADDGLASSVAGADDFSHLI